MSAEDLEIQQIFLEEARELLEVIENGFIAFDRGDLDGALFDAVFRAAHSFKGSAKSVGFDSVAASAHIMEDLLTGLKSQKIEYNPNTANQLFASLDDLKYQLEEMSTPSQKNEEKISGVKKNPEAIRVPTKKLDNVINAIGELVVHQSILVNFKNEQNLHDAQANAVINAMSKIVHNLQDLTLSLRLQPVKPLMQKMQRAVRDAAAILGKKVDIVLIGENVEVDKVILEKMTAPLTHLVRNAVDHGIEGHSLRAELGKSMNANVFLSVEGREDYTLITVKDDGHGLNAERIRQKAIERNLIHHDAELSIDEVHALIFHPGFSTKETISEISGRGVGLDVVKAAVEELKGSISIETELGSGTTFLIRLPQSFCIMEGIIVDVGTVSYIVPVPQLEETVQITDDLVTKSPSGNLVLHLRGIDIPLISLGEMLHGQGHKKSSLRRQAILTSHLGKKICFEVDAILGRQKVVIKPLASEMQNILEFAGGAILSNGEPGIILNMQILAEKEFRQQYRSVKEAA